MVDELVPRQLDTCSCGLFSLVCANSFSMRLPLSFSREDMPAIRQRLSVDLLLDHIEWTDEEAVVAARQSTLCNMYHISILSCLPERGTCCSRGTGSSRGDRSPLTRRQWQSSWHPERGAPNRKLAEEVRGARSTARRCQKQEGLFPPFHDRAA